MSDSSSATPVHAAVVDRRPIPRGALPRGVQAWLMAAIATGMIAVIFFAGDPGPVRTPQGPQPRQEQVADPARLAEYQERLRLVESRTNQEPAAPTAAPNASAGVSDSRQPPQSDDAVTADQKRRDYESLFATNVVLSRRPESDRPAISGSTRNASVTPTPSDTPPSIDDIADAVVRATSRAGAALSSVAAPSDAKTNVPTAATPVQPSSSHLADRGPTGPVSGAGPMHRLLEGTLIDTVLTNRLDGASAGPVNCLVTNPVYSHGGQQVLIPAGARVLGETKAVQSLGESRLAVTFHRLVMPDGSTYPLDDFLGANQVGDSGLRDQVNHHYWSTFGVAGAVGLISGLAQYVGTLGLNRGDGDRTLVIAGSAGDATSQASLQVMNRFLNRMPSVTIREGHRVKIYLTSDLELPAYAANSGSF